MSEEPPNEQDKPSGSQWYERVRPRKNLPSKKQQSKSPKKRAVYLFIVLVVISASLAAFFLMREPESQQALSPAPQPAAQVLPTPPPPPPTPQRDTQLEAILDDWADSHPANNWSVSVIGLDSDTRFARLNADEVFASASIYKLLLMYPLFQKYTLQQAGQASINVSGSTRNLLQCVSLMLKVSDNPCGHAVGSLVGWAAADQLLQKVGLDNTKLNSAGGSLTTAQDTAVFLKALYNNRLFDTDAKEYIIDTLYQQTWRDGIVAGCTSCKVANKTGDLGVRHDAGIVQYSGKAYVLAIFTDGASYAQIAQLTSRIHEHMSGDS